MGLFSRLRQWISSKTMLMTGRLIPDGYIYRNSTLATNETIFSAVSMLSGAIASVPITVRQDYRQLSPEEHRIAELLKFGLNPNMTTFDFIRGLETLRDVTGAGYALKDLDMRGQIQALWLVKTEKVTPYLEEDTRELYYEIQDDLTSKTVYLHNSLVLMVGHISTDGINPVNPIEVLASTLAYDKEVKEFSIDQMQTGLRANVVIKWTKTGLNKDQIAEYNQVIQQFKKSGVLYLDSGKEIQELKGNTLIDPKVFEVENITIARIARVYNIPLDKLLPGKTSYNSAEQSDLSYLRDTILPMARMYEQEFTRKLLSDTDKWRGIEIKISLNGFARADMKTRGDFYMKGIRSGWFNLDEVRGLEDMPPIPGGYGKQFFISKDLVPIEKNGVNSQGKEDDRG